MPKKAGMGPFGIFQHPFCRQAFEKMKGGHFEENNIFREKVSQCQKKLKGDALVSPGTVCYAEKQDKPFWLSSLGEMIQFNTIIFHRTFEELFWSVRVY